STVRVHVYHQEWVDGSEQRETVEDQTFELRNGEVRTLEYPIATGANYVMIELDEAGGLKLFTKQP
ncbi:MAG: hypothetical protein GY867_04535, partial [bacterium]|nr:hypothetical protein [bacterium]